MATTNFMNLTIPDVQITLGPEYASQINEAISTIDSHDHSSNKGTKVTSAGLNINGDLSFNSFNGTSFRTTQYTDQPTQPTGTGDKRVVYFQGGDLYINNSDGVAVQITSGTGLSLSSVGTIGGDYGQPGVPADVSYSDTTKTYVFTESTGVTAKMALGDILLYENTASANPITIKSPASLATGYTITLPSAVPAANNFLRQNNGNTAVEWTGLLGTTNQITVTNNSTNTTLSLPSEVTITNSSNNNPVLQLVHGGSTEGNNLQWYSNSSVLGGRLGGDNDTVGGIMSVYDITGVNENVRICGSDTSWIQNGSNFGFGTQSPSADVEIRNAVGTSGLIIKTGASGNGRVEIGNSGTGNGFGYILGQDDVGALNWQMSANTSEKSFVINNFGIGTSSPTGFQCQLATTLNGAVTFGSTTTFSTLNADEVLFLNGSKQVVGTGYTGSGAFVRNIGATINTPTITGTATNSGTISGGTYTSPTINTPTITGTATNSGTISGGTLSSNTITNSTFSGTVGGTIASGSYTPTISGALGTGQSISGTWKYHRIGNFVVVSGTWTGTTDISGSISATVTLPIASSFTLTTDAHGSQGVRDFSGASSKMSYVAGDVGSNRLLAHYDSTGSFTSVVLYIQATYEIK